MSGRLESGRYGGWFWSPALDLAVFGGSAVFALGLVLGRHLLGAAAELPEWGFLLLIVGIDVAHVYSTLFRTYLDAAELRAHPYHYALVPLLGYVLGVSAYQASAALFWSALAYLALFHFVRQAAGWVAVYRARSGRGGLFERVIDDAAIYSATLYPALVWHHELASKNFHWFVAGDFVPLPVGESFVAVAKAAWLGALAAFFGREAWRFVRGQPLLIGRLVVVITTALSWYVGIVITNSDFDFTVTNVIVHGVPYIALLWAYARATRRAIPDGGQAASGRRTLAGDIVAAGGAAFGLVLLFLAFAEELFWDRLVWHDRAWLFGDGVTLGAGALSWVVPLLALPQLTHYSLDAFLWRRSETRRLPAQRAALGFALDSGR